MTRFSRSELGHVILALALICGSSCSSRQSQGPTTPPDQDQEQGELPAPVDDVSAQPMIGPFVSIEALCESWTAQVEQPTSTCQEGEVESGEATIPGGSPLDEARLLSLLAEYSEECAVAIRSGTQWFMHSLGTCSLEGSGEDMTVVSRFQFQDIGPDRTLRLVFSTFHVSVHPVSGGFESAHEHICGIGASGTPSCFSFLSQHTEYPPDSGIGEPSARVGFDLTFEIGDRLAASAQDEENLGTVSREISPPPMGETRLVFP